MGKFGLRFKKVKNLFIEDDTSTKGGLPRKQVPIVSIEEDEAIKELLNPPKRKLVKLHVKQIDDIQKIIPHVQNKDIVIVDLENFAKKPNVQQKIANKLEGIAIANKATIVRLAGCKAHVMIIPENVEIVAYK